MRRRLLATAAMVAVMTFGVVGPAAATPATSACNGLARPTPRSMGLARRPSFGFTTFEQPITAATNRIGAMGGFPLVEAEGVLRGGPRGALLSSHRLSHVQRLARS